MRNLSALLGTLLVCASSADALPLTLEITGTVTGTSGVLGLAANPFNSGTPLTWQLTYDPLMAAPGPAGSYAFGTSLPTTAFEWQVSLAGSTYGWSGVGPTRLFTNGTGTLLGMDTSLSGYAVTGPSLSNPFPLFPVAFDATMLFPGAIAAPFALPSNVPSSSIGGAFSLMFSPCANCGGGAAGAVNGALQSVRQVPEPSTLLLLGMGVAGAYRWRRKRT